MKYPISKKDDTVDDYFGTKIADPYRWLEDDLSQETKDWVDEQNKTTQSFLKDIPYRKTIKEKLTTLYNYKKETAPFTEGDYTYYYKNDGLQNQNILYRKGKENVEELFLDPNTFSEKGTDSLGLIKYSKDGTLVAYSVSEGGSDWTRIYILRTSDKKLIEECLTDIKFSNIAWQGNEGIYYSTYKKTKGSKLSEKTSSHLIFFHKLNSKQEDDIIIFGEKENQQFRYSSCFFTSNENYLIIYSANTGNGNHIFLKDINTKSDFVRITNDDNSSSYILDIHENYFIIQTNKNAPNNKIIKVSINKPFEDNWKDLIPETKNPLGSIIGGGYIFAHYTIDVNSKVIQYDYSGNLIKELELPNLGTANIIGTKKTSSKIYYHFTNAITPTSIYCYDFKNNQTSLYWEPKIDFKPENFETKQVFYTSKDGTKIPMTISYKKGIELNSKNATILYGYGGFNHSLLSNFSSTRATWLEMGGIFAVANLRGGGEYGKSWYDQGIQFKKQNVFDDFIAASEYLVKENYTDKEHLAIQGGSNGGLLVGAVMTQRPELFKVALPAVGVLDILRYHKFTAGAGWSNDYGTSEQSKEMFENILKYSPLHNLKEGTQYPATLVTTADHDDRVVPAHSFKFAAELQAKHQGANPVLIRIDKDAGHGRGKSTEKLIDEHTDIIAFTLFNMNIDIKS